MIKVPALPRLPKIPLPRIKKEPVRDRLSDELARLKIFPQYGSSEDENAKEVEEYEKRLGLRKNVEDELRNTKFALERLEKGTYGLCAKDNKPIEAGRLKANPSSFYCAKHAAEEGKKRWWQILRRG
ncbi:hypothetical protein HYU72_01010 [Candidatus Berkelbacteria bacterium]|nr:hypothetical protein [Candidatus Berkelbacteria bacterium]